MGLKRQSDNIEYVFYDLQDSTGRLDVLITMVEPDPEFVSSALLDIVRELDAARNKLMNARRGILDSIKEQEHEC